MEFQSLILIEAGVLLYVRNGSLLFRAGRKLREGLMTFRMRVVPLIRHSGTLTPMQLHDKNCAEHGLDFVHKVVESRIKRKQFIICANCEHWIDGVHWDCGCLSQCHFDARRANPRSKGVIGDKGREA